MVVDEVIDEIKWELVEETDGSRSHILHVYAVQKNTFQSQTESPPPNNEYKTWKYIRVHSYR